MTEIACGYCKFTFKSKTELDLHRGHVHGMYGVEYYEALERKYNRK